MKCAYNDALSVTFIRHGEYDPSNPTGYHNTGLTMLGTREARSLHPQSKRDLNNTVGYSMNNARALGTIALALFPKTPDECVEQHIHKLISRNIIQILECLDYLPFIDQELEDRLGSASVNGTNLAFLVDESDAYQNETSTVFSTYSMMASDMAKLLIEQSSAVTENTLQGSSHQQLLVCGREFIYGCFRTKITEKSHGAKAANSFVSWYGETIELTDTSRTSSTHIGIQRPSIHNASQPTFRLSDSFGDVSFSITELNEIIEEQAHNLQNTTGHAV
ncbi:MAG: hypothetical protein ABI397_02560 [Candidatus Saccharimonas sp.]